jgi:aminoglycoside 6'-N-acetyltransferase
MTILRGAMVTLRPAGEADVPALTVIRAKPEVCQAWSGSANAAEITEELDDPEVETFVILHQDTIVGAIQCHTEDDEMYRHAGIDIYLDPDVHGRGLGTDSVRTLARHLIEARGHHRLTIDPAATNAAAIRCYTKVGFRPVGVMRQYERGLDGTFHDGLLMDLLAQDLTN